MHIIMHNLKTKYWNQQKFRKLPFLLISSNFIKKDVVRITDFNMLSSEFVWYLFIPNLRRIWQISVVYVDGQVCKWCIYWGVCLFVFVSFCFEVFFLILFFFSFCFYNHYIFIYHYLINFSLFFLCSISVCDWCFVFVFNTFIFRKKLI